MRTVELKVIKKCDKNVRVARKKKCACFFFFFSKKEEINFTFN